jgi:hypothetical protein
MATNNQDVETIGTMRLFPGHATQQVEFDGRKADPTKWYYEPGDYDGDLLYSKAYGSRAEAFYAVNRAIDYANQDETPVPRLERDWPYGRYDASEST